jgi:outer membrane protein W
MRSFFRVFIFTILFSLTFAGDEAVAAIDPDQPAVEAGDATSVLGTRYDRESDYDRHKFSLSPMVGGTGYAGNWYGHISNKYTFGLAAEYHFTPYIAAELEAGYAQYSIGYAPAMAPWYGGFTHNFDQWDVGLSGKFYPLPYSRFKPYLGAGLMVVDYEHMRYQVANPFSQYGATILSTQLMAGLDVNVTDRVSIGARGSYVIPTFNTPATSQTPWGTAAPGFEEADAISTGFFRVMGNVKVGL